MQNGPSCQIATAVGAVAGATKGVLDGITGRVTDAVEESPVDDPFVLTVIGLLLLHDRRLGTLLLSQVVRTLGVDRDRDRLA